MGAYVLRRAIQAIVLLFVVSLVTFYLIHRAPGGPAMLANPDLTQEQVAEMSAELQLDDPLIVQYGRWLWRTVQGDLGKSIRTGEPVAEVLGRRVPTSFLVGFSGLIFGIVLGLSVAIISALRPGSKIDMFGTFLALGGAALPSFWQALLFMYVFAVILHWLPPSGYTSPLVDPWLSAKMLFMPAVVLGTHSAAVIMRQGRSALVEVLEQDYITTARSKGLRENLVVGTHALKNAMIPIATILGLQVGNLVSGAAIVETVFAIPGVGRAAVDAIFFRDYPMLQGAILLLTFAAIVANLLTDLAYGYLDPRIRYQ